MAKTRITDHEIFLVLPKWAYAKVWDQLTHNTRHGGPIGLGNVMVNGCMLTWSDNRDKVGLCRVVGNSLKKINLGG